MKYRKDEENIVCVPDAINEEEKKKRKKNNTNRRQNKTNGDVQLVIYVMVQFNCKYKYKYQSYNLLHIHLICPLAYEPISHFMYFYLFIYSYE